MGHPDFERSFINPWQARLLVGTHGPNGDYDLEKRWEDRKRVEELDVEPLVKACIVFIILLVINLVTLLPLLMALFGPTALYLAMVGMKSYQREITGHSTWKSRRQQAVKLLQLIYLFGDNGCQ